MRLLITILLLTNIQAYAQGVEINLGYLWSVPKVTNDALMYGSQFIAGSADGLNQAIAVHRFGAGTRFWGYKNSWKNKYRNWNIGDKREAFFGSKNVLVAFTDGYHLTRFIDRSFTLGSLCFALREKNTWKQIVKKLIISAVINRAGFCLVYDGLLRQ
jgi:hypothetical protein